VKPLRILLGDDHSLILKGIKGLLENHFDVVGVAENGKVLVEAALRLEPDLVVLDVGMPILNGIDAASQIKKALPSTRLIFLSMHANPIYLRKALGAGAAGYVLKSGAAEELITAIEEVCKGNTYVTPNFGHTVIESVRHPRGKPSRRVIELTDRQKQILQLVAEGRQNKEIAQIIHVSVKTVEFHRGRLSVKLGARSVADLTKFAIQQGLIDVSGG